LQILGYIEHIGPTEIQGWAYSPDSEDLKLTIRASLDEMVIGAGAASEFREDLLLLGFGQGDHGFTIAFDIPVNPGDLDLIEIVAIAPDQTMHRLALRPQAGAPPDKPALDEAASDATETAPAARAAEPGNTPAPPHLAGPRHDPASRAAEAERDFEALTGGSIGSNPAAHPTPAATEAGPHDTGPHDTGPHDTGAAAVEATAFLPRRDPTSPGPIAIPGAAALHAAPDTWTEPKLFVLGAARSGTSAMFSALTDVLGVPGFGESHVIPAFQRMVYQLRLYTDLFAAQDEDIMIKRMDRPDLEHALHQYARNFYWTTFDGKGFVDKTPTGEAIYGAPLIEEIFPDSHLIVMRRTGIEVVKSFRLKFAADFTKACRAWAEAMTGILHARPLCTRMMEVDQFEMANSPFETGHTLATWLGRPDKADALARYFASTRVEKSSTHDWSQRLTLSDVDWSPQEKDIFVRTCGPMMDAFGYAM
jgi:hypothetical protein